MDSAGVERASGSASRIDISEKEGNASLIMARSYSDADRELSQPKAHYDLFRTLIVTILIFR